MSTAFSFVLVLLGSVAAGEIPAMAAVSNSPVIVALPSPVPALQMIPSINPTRFNMGTPNEASIIFDVPMTYNVSVKRWISIFQTKWRSNFLVYLERSTRYLPLMKRVMKSEGLPQDLAYISLIESGFSTTAISSAKAVGPWQFIQSTGNRFGLKTDWWLDERRDFEKSSKAAASYLKLLYGYFKHWYLAAAAYNWGEQKIKRLIQQHQTTDFWKLAAYGGMAEETEQYVPKLIAAILIAKAPNLYGFHGLKIQKPFSYEFMIVPGGTDLVNLADAIAIAREDLREMNPEITEGFIPDEVNWHKIRIPKGKAKAAKRYIKLQVR